jgi:hypothetical protein
MVGSGGVFSSAGVMVMGTICVTKLYPQGSGDLDLSPLPEAASPSSKESSRVLCKDGDPLCMIPTNIAPESPS